MMEAIKRVLQWVWKMSEGFGLTICMVIVSLCTTSYLRIVEEFRVISHDALTSTLPAALIESGMWYLTLVIVSIFLARQLFDRVS